MLLRALFASAFRECHWDKAKTPPLVSAGYCSFPIKSSNPIRVERRLSCLLKAAVETYFHAILHFDCAQRED
jgi:hypothetical protein